MTLTISGPEIYKNMELYGVIKDGRSIGQLIFDDNESTGNKFKFQPFHNGFKLNVSEMEAILRLMKSKGVF